MSFGRKDSSLYLWRALISPVPYALNYDVPMIKTECHGVNHLFLASTSILSKSHLISQSNFVLYLQNLGIGWIVL